MYQVTTLPMVREGVLMHLLVEHLIQIVGGTC